MAKSKCDCILVDVLNQVDDKIKKYVGAKHYLIPLNRLNKIKHHKKIHYNHYTRGE